MLRVLIVEDEAWMRESLHKVLSRGGSDIAVAAACAGGGEALRLAGAGLPFDLALVDLGLPDIAGAQVIAGLRRTRPAVVSVALTIFDDSPSVFEALQAGARGYLLKGTPPRRLVPALHEAAAGGAPMSPPIARMVLDALVARDGPPWPGPTEGPQGPWSAGPPAAALTRREVEVLSLLGTGVTYAEVAAALGIGLGTVQSHVKHIYEKLEINSKTEAAVIAVKLGLA